MYLQTCSCEFSWLVRDGTSYNTDEISSSALHFSFFFSSADIKDTFCFGLHLFLQAMIQMSNRSIICPSLTYVQPLCKTGHALHIIILQRLCNEFISNLQFYSNMKVISSHFLRCV